MNRRALLGGGLLLALVVLVWGASAILAGRPNPILVTIATAGGATPAAPAPVAPVAPATAAGARSIEVQVARARPLSIEVDEIPVAGGPLGPGETMPVADPDAVAAEWTELRAALDAWLAGAGKGLRVEQSWESTEIRSRFSFRPDRVRVVLHARLVPASNDGT